MTEYIYSERDEYDNSLLKRFMINIYDFCEGL